MNEINAPASLAFIFRLLDINGQGYLDEFTISYFVRSLAPLVPVQINMSNLTVR
jgi:hypothetical protein